MNESPSSLRPFRFAFAAFNCLIGLDRSTQDKAKAKGWEAQAARVTCHASRGVHEPRAFDPSTGRGYAAHDGTE